MQPLNHNPRITEAQDESFSLADDEEGYITNRPHQQDQRREYAVGMGLRRCVESGGDLHAIINSNPSRFGFNEMPQYSNIDYKMIGCLHSRNIDQQDLQNDEKTVKLQLKNYPELPQDKSHFQFESPHSCPQQVAPSSFCTAQ